MLTYTLQPQSHIIYTTSRNSIKLKPDSR